IVEPTEHIGSIIDQIDIGFRVEIAEELIGKLQGIDMSHFLRGIHIQESAFDRLRGANMARAGRGREHQHFIEHSQLLVISFGRLSSIGPMKTTDEGRKKSDGRRTTDDGRKNYKKLRISNSC